MKKTHIMGILNVTPDSFSDGGRYYSVEHAVSHAQRMVDDGADSIDIGGESTRPRAVPVSAEEEMRRVLPVIEQIRDLGVQISIDTTKPEVADAALEAGATIINDVTGFRNEQMLTIAKKHGAKIIIMHMQGEPQTMQANPNYDDVVEDVYAFFEKQTQLAKKHGIFDIVVDPGIGFGKTLEHNVLLLQHIKRFKELGHRVMIGASRKSFMEKIIPGLAVDQRLSGTIATNTVAIMNGASVLRVHDVKQNVQAARITEALLHN